MKVSQLIQRLRTKLASATYGTPARVAGAGDFNQVLEGSRFTAPMLFVTLGNTDVRNKSEPSSNLMITEITERINLIAVLSSKPDTTGHDPQSLVHDVRLDILKAIYGWNPSIADERDLNTYGYATKELTYASDTFLQMHNEWYAHQFEFNLVSDLNQGEQGIGCVMPEDEAVALENIHANVTPVDVNPDPDNPDFEIDADTA